MSRAEIVVDVAAIRHNVRVLKRHAGVPMMAVVKADGYGHGLLETARAAREAGADWLGVASLDEAIALREAGDRGPLLAWLVVPSEDVTPAVRAHIDITAYSIPDLDRIAEAARTTGLRPRVQLKVDTGLHRGGVPMSLWAETAAHARALEQQGLLRVTGIWSHFSSSEEPDDPANDEQEKVFREALDRAAEAGLRPEVRHLANSAAAILRPSARFDLVRCGIAMYGLDPAPGVSPDLGLVPAMTVRAELAMIKPIAAGGSVSYNHRWTASAPTMLGLVPVGYGDGLPRHASNRAEVWVTGARRPVRGTVCMDQVVVDLGQAGDDLPEPGADAILWGSGALGEPTAQDWADAAGTISYEMVTRIGGRLVRRHVDSDVDRDTDSTSAKETP